MLISLLCVILSPIGTSAQDDTLCFELPKAKKLLKELDKLEKEGPPSVSDVEEAVAEAPEDDMDVIEISDEAAGEDLVEGFAGDDEELEDADEISLDGDDEEGSEGLSLDEDSDLESDQQETEEESGELDLPMDTGDIMIGEEGEGEDAVDLVGIQEDESSEEEEDLGAADGGGGHEGEGAFAMADDG